jgi:hypothetical protein
MKEFELGENKLKIKLKYRNDEIRFRAIAEYLLSWLFDVSIEGTSRS